MTFAFRMAGRPFDIVDATGFDFVRRDGVRPRWFLGLMWPEDIVASGLKERRRPLLRAESGAAIAAWTRLQRDNAPLRSLRDDCLVSAPLTRFDTALISQAGPEWEVVATDRADAASLVR